MSCSMIPPNHPQCNSGSIKSIYLVNRTKMKKTKQQLEEENRKLKKEIEDNKLRICDLNQKLECQFHLKTIEQRYKDLMKETELLRVIKEQAKLITKHVW